MLLYILNLIVLVLFVCITYYLSVNPLFGCYTRPALNAVLFILNILGIKISIIYFDIDGLKDANNRWGKAESSRRIKESIKCRWYDIILIGNWFSGDELVCIVFSKDAYGFANRIQNELNVRNMSATFVIQHGIKPHADYINAAEVEVSSLKDKGIRGIIHIKD